MDFANRALFLLLFLGCFTGFISPPVALTIGIFFGLILSNPFPKQTRFGSQWLLQGSLIGLGFGMNIHEVLKAGSRGFLYTALGISTALIAGTVIGKWLQIRGNSSYLISVGTAVCGGSAIAAVAPILHAEEEEISVSLGTVFVLNSAALILFPPLGHYLNLSQTQFGLWAAIAIHDTSSVVGAAARYGQQALLIGTTVKLARALWIAPLSLAIAAMKHSKAKIQFPWFILFFCIAALVNTFSTASAPLMKNLFQLGRLGLTATLFLIGSGLSLATLKKVGWRPMVQGVLLWIVVGLSSLYLIKSGWIGL